MRSTLRALGGLDPRRARTLATVLVFVGLVATAGCTGLLSDDEGAPGAGSDPVEFVPADQDVLIHVDGAILQDETTITAIERLGGQQLEGQGLQSDLEESYDQIEEETGLDPRDFEEALVYGTYPDQGVQADPSAQDEVGIVVRGSWAQDDIVSAMEDSGTELEAQSYEGQDVLYEVPASTPGGEPTYFGVLAENTFVIGSESMVTGALDVSYSGADSVSGPVRDAYDDAPDGLITFAASVPEEQLGGVAGGQSGQSPAQDVEAINGVYTTEGDSVRLVTQLLVSDEESATTLRDAVQGVIAQVQLGAPEYSEYLNSVEVSQDGSTVEVSIELTVDEIEQLLEQQTGGTAA